jgi:DNA repair protein RadC
MILFVQDSAGSYQPASNDVIVKEALRVTQKAVRSGPMLGTPRSVKDFLMVRLSHLPYEIFAVVFVDNRNRFVAFEEMFRGTVDSAAVYPREVVKSALHHNAAAVILAHNHPSGEPEPSQADEIITRRLKQALALVDIRVLDHVVIGADFCESFAERGLL